MNQNHLNSQNVLSFRMFSRKKYAAFNSLGKCIKISTLGVACTLIASPVQSQSKTDTDTISSNIDLEEVEVVGQKSTILIDELPRMVEVIDAQIIQNSPSQSFQDLIQFSSNIDIRQRGQFGIQSDVSIRGGSFDNVLILQNGINLTDPQTGHHNLNLPIDRESIYKIEILNGPAARALGANAFSGAINVVTRPALKNQVSASVSFGSYGFFKGHLGVNLVTKNSRHLISGSYAQSDGYIENTDFSTMNFYYHGEYQFAGNISAFTQLGINNKRFGANSYYTPRFPEQFEETATVYLSAGISMGSVIRVKPTVYWRRHIDRFELFREDKNYYRLENGITVSNKPAETIYDTATWYSNHNHHLTDVFGAKINASHKSNLGTTTLGSAIRSENIISNALGKDLANPIPISGYGSLYYTKQDYRNNFDLFFEHAYQGSKYFISGGALLNWNSFEPQMLNFVPGIDVSFSPIKQVSIVGSYNYTIGQPTFTDLSYQGPANSGNSALKPYYQHSGEMGVKLNFGNIQTGLMEFYSKGKNNIDWVFNETNNRFMAMNIDLSENFGTETYLRFKNTNNSILNIFVNEIYIGYTYIDTYRRTPENISKYSNIKHKAVARLNQQLTKRLSLSWNIMYKQRIGSYPGYDFEADEYTHNEYPEIILVDLRASYLVKDFLFYIEGSNLLDKYYVESGSIPQPGRWFKGGIRYSLNY